MQSPPLPSAAPSGSDQVPPSSSHSSSHSYAGTQYSDAQPPQPLHHHPPQPQQQQTGYQTPRATPVSQTNAGLAINTHAAANNNPARQPQSQSQSQYSPPGHYAAQETTPRPELTTSRSFTQQQQQQQAVLADDASSMSNNGTMPAPKAVRAANGNRQSVHAGMMSREGSYAQQGGQMPTYNASVGPPGSSQGQQYKTTQGQAQQQQGDVGRATPQPQVVGDEMSEEDITQLVKDHKELRKLCRRSSLSSNLLTHYR